MANIYINGVDETVKAQANCAFDQMGLSMTAGIKLYLHYVAHHQHIPFEPGGGKKELE